MAERTMQRDGIVGLIEQTLSEAATVDESLAASMKTGGAAIVGNAPNDQYPDAATAQTRGKVLLEVREAWTKMTNDRRREVLTELILELAEKYGVEDPHVDIVGIPDDRERGLPRYGDWAEGTKALRFNANDLADLQIAFSAIAHEMRHAGQNKMAQEAEPGAWDRFLQDIGVEDKPQSTLLARLSGSALEGEEDEADGDDMADAVVGHGDTTQRPPG